MSLHNSINGALPKKQIGMAKPIQYCKVKKDNNNNDKKF